MVFYCFIFRYCFYWLSLFDANADLWLLSCAFIRCKPVLLLSHFTFADIASNLFLTFIYRITIINRIYCWYIFDILRQMASRFLDAQDSRFLIISRGLYAYTWCDWAWCLKRAKISRALPHRSGRCFSFRSLIAVCHLISIYAWWLDMTRRDRQQRKVLVSFTASTTQVSRRL